MSVPLSAIGHVVGAVPGRGDRLERPAGAVDDVAVREHAVGPEIHVAGGIERSHVVADIERTRRAMRPLAEVGAPVAALIRAAAGEWSRWVWVTKMCVTVSPRTASSSAAMCALIERPGIDDRDAAAADDVAHRPLERERPRIVAKEAPDAGRHLLDLSGRQVEASCRRECRRSWRRAHARSSARSQSLPFEYGHCAANSVLFPLPLVGEG